MLRQRSCLVGPRVRALREGMDLSLRDLAERSGVSAPMLSPGRARRDQPDAVGRRRGSPPGSSSRSRSCCGSTRADGVTVVRAAERRSGGARARGHATRSSPRRCRASAPRCPCTRSAPGAATGGPDDPPMHEPGSRETAVVARAAGCGSSATAPRTTWRGRRRDLRRRPAPPLREPRRRATPASSRSWPPGLGGADLMAARRCFDKIWDAHEVAEGLLYIDLHLVHEVTSPAGLRVAAAGRAARSAGPTARSPPPTTTCPPTAPPRAAQIRDQLSRVQVETLERNCAEFGVPDLLDRLRAPGHRARDRPRAGRHPAGHDDRLRRLAHLHPRRLRRAGLRHRHERGRARARHPDARSSASRARCGSSTRASSASASRPRT